MMAACSAKPTGSTVAQKRGVLLILRCVNALMASTKAACWAGDTKEPSCAQFASAVSAPAGREAGRLPGGSRVETGISARGRNDGACAIKLGRRLGREFERSGGGLGRGTRCGSGSGNCLGSGAGSGGRGPRLGGRAEHELSAIKGGGRAERHNRHIDRIYGGKICDRSAIFT